ncbi:hypothetical protein PPL_08431 [Heterostelium album PN500]|uniref:SCP domain-containing protein n=1 Tax=Heterostelium pallidum (strain ATCC 26659 / Pp 5 / PN500) TaxID=670386 RepID=D3BI63_HETP5|nr:hypothetical protein PPL_08431 [Heterostelium album PN500]EFA78963.1 hypothetical protein PPL_08431 [Heterostelium album PN500]|eukprot:XP_020431087.1 hypothetical protein PPL_08431 [Heterostelium album PN500]
MDLEIISQLLTLVNQERSRYNLQPVYSDRILNICAQQQSTYQADIDQMTHNNPRGNLTRRTRILGGQYVLWEENVAVGYRNAQEVMRGWMNSPGHRRNILSPSINRMGSSKIISSTGRSYWTQCFAQSNFDSSQMFSSEN